MKRAWVLPAPLQNLCYISVSNTYGNVIVGAGYGADGSNGSYDNEYNFYGGNDYKQYHECCGQVMTKFTKRVSVACI